MASEVKVPLASIPRLSPARRWAWLAGCLLPPLAGLAWIAGPARLLPDVPLASAVGGVLLVLLALCTFTDVAWQKIYNWATYPAFLWAVLASVLPFPDSWNLGTVGLTSSLLGAVIGFVGVAVAYEMSGGGAGDVKLSTALGAWLGPQQTILALVGAYALAGVVILSWLVWTHGPIRVFGTLLRRLGCVLFPGWVRPPADEKTLFLRQGVPMSPFFAAGTLVVLLGGRVL